MYISDLTSRVNQLLPISCYLATGKLANYQKELSGVESNSIEGLSDARTREFRAGRSIAKDAAKYLGYKISSVPKGNDGCPIWPNSVVGSISHKAGFCGALIGKREYYTSLGFDIEFVEAMEENVWKTFASTEEIDQASICNMDSSLFANAIFSAKEAFFKCLYPLHNPESLSMADIFISAKKNRDHIVTTTNYNNKNYSGGIVLNSRILVSWAVSSRD